MGAKAVWWEVDGLPQQLAIVLSITVFSHILLLLPKCYILTTFLFLGFPLSPFAIPSLFPSSPSPFSFSLLLFFSFPLFISPYSLSSLSTPLTHLCLSLPLSLPLFSFSPFSLSHSISPSYFLPPLALPSSQLPADGSFYPNWQQCVMNFETNATNTTIMECSFTKQSNDTVLKIAWNGSDIYST